MALTTNRNVTLWTTEYGNTIRAETNCDDIASASAIKIKMRKASAHTTTAELTATSVGDTNWSVDAIIAADWLSTRQGLWEAQVEATFATGKFLGKLFWVTICAPFSQTAS